MIGLFIWAIYIGGFGAFYRLERRRNGRLYSLVSAGSWPVDLGATLARAAWHLENPRD